MRKIFNTNNFFRMSVVNEKIFLIKKFNLLNFLIENVFERTERMRKKIGVVENFSYSLRSFKIRHTI